MEEIVSMFLLVVATALRTSMAAILLVHVLLVSIKLDIANATMDLFATIAP
jgi:hypothetical protein